MYFLSLSPVLKKNVIYQHNRHILLSISSLIKTHKRNSFDIQADIENLSTTLNHVRICQKCHAISEG